MRYLPCLYRPCTASCDTVDAKGTSRLVKGDDWATLLGTNPHRLPRQWWPHLLRERLRKLICGNNPLKVRLSYSSSLAYHHPLQWTTVTQTSWPTFLLQFFPDFRYCYGFKNNILSIFDYSKVNFSHHHLIINGLGVISHNTITMYFWWNFLSLIYVMNSLVVYTRSVCHVQSTCVWASTNC